jgi:hypothetical protein
MRDAWIGPERARAWTSTGWRATRVRIVHMPRR